MISVLIDDLDVSHHCMSIGGLTRRIESDDDIAGVIASDGVSIELPIRYAPSLSESNLDVNMVRVQITHSGHSLFEGIVDTSSVHYNSSLTVQFSAVEDMFGMRTAVFTPRTRLYLPPVVVITKLSADTITVTHAAMSRPFYESGEVIGLWSAQSNTYTQMLGIVHVFDSFVTGFEHVVTLQVSPSVAAFDLSDCEVHRFSKEVNGVNINASPMWVDGNAYVRALTGLPIDREITGFGLLPIDSVLFGAELPMSRIDIFKALVAQVGYVTSRHGSLLCYSLSQILGGSITADLHLSSVIAYDMAYEWAKRQDEIIVTMGGLMSARRALDVVREGRSLTKNLLPGGLYADVETAADMYALWYMSRRAALRLSVSLSPATATIAPTSVIAFKERKWFVIRTAVDVRQMTIDIETVEV